jgi:Domain of unknown function (DUF4189)
MRCILVITLFLLVITLGSSPSRADSALAIGLPADVAGFGFAVGQSLNESSFAEARRKAVEGCYKSPGASEAAKKLCKVIATFRDQCFAVAIDPKAGTPGVGWAIAETRDLADQAAIEQCRGTAGASRRDYCAISHPDVDHGCDGKAR